MDGVQKSHALLVLATCPAGPAYTACQVHTILLLVAPLVLNISQCSDLLQVLRAQYNWWWFLAPLGLGIIWAIRQSGPIESTIRSLHRHRRPGITTGHKGHVPLKPFPLGFISSNMGLGQRAWHMYSLIICFNSSSDSLQGLCFILPVIQPCLSGQLRTCYGLHKPAFWNPQMCHQSNSIRNILVSIIMQHSRLNPKMTAMLLQLSQHNWNDLHILLFHVIFLFNWECCKVIERQINYIQVVLF